MDTLTLTHPDEDVRPFVYSRDELAVALGISVRKVAELLKFPDCPGRNSNGSYPLKEWKEFFKKYDARAAGNDRELYAIRLRERAAKAELAELEVRERLHELVRCADVRAMLRKLGEFVRGELVRVLRKELRESSPTGIKENSPEAERLDAIADSVACGVLETVSDELKKTEFQISRGVRRV